MVEDGHGPITQAERIDAEITAAAMTCRDCARLILISLCTKGSLAMSDSTKVTRQQLYKQVWAKPATKLAKEYGISDVALAKICRKHNIPKPPLGHWAKVQHGHKVHQPPLPEVDDPYLQTIRITPSPDNEGAADLQPETQGQIQAEQSQEKKIVVANVLVSPHVLVARTERSLRSASPDDCGLVRPTGKGCLDVAVGRDSVDRAMLIMDAFTKAVESRGMSVVVRDGEDGSATIVEIEGEGIDVRLTEVLGERTRQLTPEQKRQNDEYKVLQPHSETEKYPSGPLVLSLKGRSHARHRCSETDGTPLGDKLNGVMAWLHKEADRIRARNRAREEQQRLWAEQQKRWEEEERHRREEEQRTKQLDADISAWRKAQRMRAYVAAVEQAAVRKSGPIDPSSKLGRWLTWAKNRIVEIDPIKV